MRANARILQQVQDGCDNRCDKPLDPGQPGDKNHDNTHASQRGADEKVKDQK